MIQHQDTISLHGLRAHGHHGVLAREREQGQEFVADITLYLDTRAAAAADDLAATLSYATVAEQVISLLGGEPVDLLETLAARIAEHVLDHDLVHAVDVTLHKPQAPIPVPFDDVTLNIYRQRSRVWEPPQAAIALGGNLGDVAATMRQALRALQFHPAIDVVAVSPVARTAAHVPVGEETQPDYLNAVALLDSHLGPHELLAVCQGIEVAHGRQRGEQWGARALDIDLVTMGELRCDDDRLILPHPRAAERIFVLAPWLAVDPGANLPGHGAVADLLAELTEELRWVSGPWQADSATWAQQGIGTGPSPDDERETATGPKRCQR